MKNKDREEVLDRIEIEGFDYCFVSYSSFSEIKDKKFHELRTAFLESRKALADYLGADA